MVPGRPSLRAEAARDHHGMARKKKARSRRRRVGGGDGRRETPDAETVGPLDLDLHVVTRTARGALHRAPRAPPEVHLSLEPDGVGSAGPPRVSRGIERGRDADARARPRTRSRTRAPRRNARGRRRDDVCTRAGSGLPLGRRLSGRALGRLARRETSTGTMRTTRTTAKIAWAARGANAKASVRGDSGGRPEGRDAHRVAVAAAAAVESRPAPPPPDTSGAFAAAIRSPAAFLKGLSPCAARGDAKGRSVV